MSNATATAPAVSGRTCNYRAAVDGELHEGILTITEHTGVKVKRVVKRDYFVAQHETHPGITSYLLIKDDDRGREELAAGRAGQGRTGDCYEVAVIRKNRSLCTCPGFKKHLNCVHASAMTALALAGRLKKPEAPADDSDGF